MPGVAALASDRGGMRYTGYSERNRDDALQDAAAADRAQERGRPLRYAVVRIATEKISPDRVTGRGSGPPWRSWPA